MSDWRTGQLIDFIKLKRGYDLRKDDRGCGVVPVVSSSGVSGSHNEAKVKSPGVVTGRYGTIGQVFYVTQDFWPLNTTLYVQDFKGNIPRFIFYFLKSIDFLGYSDKSSVPGINRNHVHQAVVSLPPLPEQRAIAHILGSLDDKIEANRRQNETLEAIARAIFRSWFVDFDPVHAKARGEQPAGMDAATAALFPDRFEDSALGPIPAGWRVGKLGDVVEQRKDRVGNRDAVVLSAVSTGELVRSDDYFSKRVYSKQIDNYIAVQEWDYAYNPSRINIGSIGMLREPILGGVSPVYVVLSCDPGFHWFIHFSLQLPSTQYWINTLASGSVRQSLPFSDFESIPIVLPPLAAIRAFNSVWEQKYVLIISLQREIRVLAETRDALLPKLVSGEIRVGGMED
jgi:type I restriction enzyme, S subunit